MYVRSFLTAFLTSKKIIQKLRSICPLVVEASSVVSSNCFNAI